MKITHICLCGPLTDNWSYQDNLLPKYHKALGHDVSVITSQYIWNDKGYIDVDNRESYQNEYGIKTIRIKSKYNTTVKSKFKRYKNLYQNLCNEKPNVLFVHGLQFLEIRDVVKYVKKHPEIIVYVDNHADFSNSATNWISHKILHRIIWKWCGNLIEPYTRTFYGVLPARVEFLKKVYNLPEQKIELLLMGADDDKVDIAKQSFVKEEIRKRHGITSKDFLIITGGKIDLAKKQTLMLMKAVKEINQKDIKLIVFGSVVDELEEEMRSLVDNDKVQYIGWISPDESYNYFGAAELAFFPGRHSVFWEQVVGLGIPLIVKYWEGTTHVDVGGNCLFLNSDSTEEIKEKILHVINTPSFYKKMKYVAETKGMEDFLYSRIAKQSIESSEIF
ncbi:glycosyltransferase family 4 protein [Bacillus salipaludis]|uniref:glycosyltransferase family 4 protein n=1 Tax=Bacillus salipaludis TaxID=2547811 RepID=UPI003D1A9076